jgi:hypothetical protein
MFIEGGVFNAVTVTVILIVIVIVIVIRCAKSTPRILHVKDQEKTYLASTPGILHLKDQEKHTWQALHVKDKKKEKLPGKHATHTSCE